MGYKELYLFVEGPDDSSFFNQVFRSLFLKFYNEVRIIEYSQIKCQKRANLIRGIKAQNYDFLYFSDLDLTPCATQKKEKVKECLSHQYDADKIFIVIKEIESWYMAGLKEQKFREFFDKEQRDTNDITKELFSQRKLPDFDSDIDFKAEILKHFKIETACRKNKSFKYFYTKFFKTED